MITLISFLFTLIGSINWFCIGVLQYDFIAGIFGSQANIFSRIIYAFIGLSAVWIIYSLIKEKGKLKIFGRSNGKGLLSKLGKKSNQNNKESVGHTHYNAENTTAETPQNHNQNQGFYNANTANAHLQETQSTHYTPPIEKQNNSDAHTPETKSTHNISPKERQNNTEAQDRQNSFNAIFDEQTEKQNNSNKQKPDS